MTLSCAALLTLLTPISSTVWTERGTIGAQVQMGDFCPIDAEVRITPNVLSGSEKGGTVTVHVKFNGALPLIYGEGEIDPGSVSLRAIGGGSTGASRGDKNPLKFSKAAVIDSIGGAPTGETEVTFELHGRAGGCDFSGSDTVTYRPPKKTPTPTHTTTASPAAKAKSANEPLDTGADAPMIAAPPTPTATPLATQIQEPQATLAPSTTPTAPVKVRERATATPTPAPSAVVEPTALPTATAGATATPEPTTVPATVPTTVPTTPAQPTATTRSATATPEPSIAPTTDPARSPAGSAQPSPGPTRRP